MNLIFLAKSTPIKQRLLGLLSQVVEVVGGTLEGSSAFFPPLFFSLLELVNYQTTGAEAWDNPELPLASDQDSSQFISGHGQICAQLFCKGSCP